MEYKVEEIKNMMRDIQKCHNNKQCVQLYDGTLYSWVYKSKDNIYLLEIENNHNTTTLLFNMKNEEDVEGLFEIALLLKESY